MNFVSKTLGALSLAILALTITGGPANAVLVDFEEFFIRNHNPGGTITPPWDSDMGIVENAAGDGFSAWTPRSGQKVGYGTGLFDGMQLNQLCTVDWDRTGGITTIVSYLNIWVTDGVNYAVISSEDDYRGTDFQTRDSWKIFEYSLGGFDWLFDSGTGGRSGSQYLTLNGSNATLADISDSVLVYAGPVGPTPGVGTGAPRAGYGFNLIWGDTQSNYTAQQSLNNLSVTWKDGSGGMTTYEAGEVPEPATMALIGSGLAAMA
ncbi:MAG: PEP-CTERM sorting domain-containing protein, partial [Candidatus Omnitrophica bacterium]|nr:PEP-CTERM sorting domain-containing protein [Candidatus Omnitrophota bacterium]